MVVCLFEEHQVDRQRQAQAPGLVEQVEEQ